MNWILAKKKLSGNCIQLDVAAPEIAAVVQYGQYVMVRFAHESGFSSLIVSDFDARTGRLSVLISESDSSHLNYLKTGDEIISVEGPFGEGFDVDKPGNVLCVAGGEGISLLYPLAKAIRKAGSNMLTILVSNSDEAIVLETELKRLSSQFVVFHEDGNQLIGNTLGNEMAKMLVGRSVDRIVSIGDVYTLKESFVYINRHCQIPSTCYLNTIGSSSSVLKGIFKVSTCRRSKYVSVDGFNFNAYYSTFDRFVQRFYPESAITSTLAIPQKERELSD
jgi:ferredoxin--NADP+ reductase